MLLLELGSDHGDGTQHFRAGESSLMETQDCLFPPAEPCGAAGFLQISNSLYMSASLHLTRPRGSRQRRKGD